MSGTMVFQVDYARRLAALERVATEEGVERGLVSLRMLDVQKRWKEQIEKSCLEMMGGMNETVAAYQEIAQEAVSRVPRTVVMIEDAKQ